MATTGAGSGGGRRKRLTAHLEAAFAEIERLADVYLAGIETLERNVRAGLSTGAVRKWFLLYLRIVDLGVQIRRGEIRHRTAQQFSHQCMHTTGTKGAVHSGLSIDDANAVYLALERAKLSESRLEVYFMRMDTLDNDRVGALDIRLNKCLDSLLSTQSASFLALEVNGSDPHQELLVKGAQSVDAARRTCFRPTDCTCDVDATPWSDFSLESVDADTIDLTQEAGATSVSSSASAPSATSRSFISATSTTALLREPAAAAGVTSSATGSDEVALSELKRQFGFEPLAGASDGEDELLVKRRRLAAQRDQATSSSSAATATRRLTPMQIYTRKCRAKGVEPKKKLRDLFVVTDGALHLDLSPIGFHSPENLQDVVDVVTAAELPIRSLDATNNFFNAHSFELFCDLLRLPVLTQHIQKLVLRCVALPQRSDFPVLLRILSNTDNGALAQLRELDLSYNTFSEDSVLCLDAVLTGLKRLEKLSLASCFTKAPDPEVVEVAVVKDLVRTALATCCNQLTSLNFGSNWMSFPLLNSLFAPESALHELSITQMTFFCFETAGFDASMWDFNFQHLEALTLSETKHSRSDYLPVFLDVLIQSFKTGFVQLKHLDLTLGAVGQSPAEQQRASLELDGVVIDLLQQIGGYGLLQTLRLRMDRPMSASAVPNYERVLAVLLAGGFPVCESLDLSLGLPLPIAALRDLIGTAQLPKTRNLKLSIVALDAEDPFTASGGYGASHSGDALSFATAFQALAGVEEFTLEVKVCEARRAEILSDQVIHELSEAWRGLDAQQPPPSAVAPPKAVRGVAMTKRKIRRPRGSVALQPRESALATFVFVFSKSAARGEE